MAVNDIFEATLSWSIVGNTIVNVMHWRQNVYDGSSSRPALCVLMLKEIETETLANWEPTGSDQVSLIKLEAYVVNSPTDFGAEPVNFNGALTGDVMPVRSNPVMRKLTLLRGRSYRGRMFLPPIREADQDAGTIVGAHRTALENWVDLLRNLNDGAGNTWKMCVFSPTLSTFPGGPFISTDVSSVQADLVLGGIRKRQSPS